MRNFLQNTVPSLCLSAFPLPPPSPILKAGGKFGSIVGRGGALIYLSWGFQQNVSMLESCFSSVVFFFQKGWKETTIFKANSCGIFELYLWYLEWKPFQCLYIYIIRAVCSSVLDYLPSIHETLCLTLSVKQQKTKISKLKHWEKYPSLLSLIFHLRNV